MLGRAAFLVGGPAGFDWWGFGFTELFCLVWRWVILDLCWFRGLDARVYLVTGCFRGVLLLG